MSKENQGHDHQPNQLPEEETPLQGALAERLRAITDAALEKAQERRAEREREEYEHAQKIIRDLEKLALEQAQQGNNHLVVMDVTYSRNPSYVEPEGFSLDPSHLTGASRHVYEYCQREGLHPSLISRWTIIMENVHRIDFSLVISW